MEESDDNVDRIAYFSAVNQMLTEHGYEKISSEEETSNVERMRKEGQYYLDCVNAIVDMRTIKGLEQE